MRTSVRRAKRDALARVGNKTVNDILQALSQFNTKICNVKKFSEYILMKNMYNKMYLNNHYSQEIYRKYNWYYYINKQRSVDNLLNNILATFSKNNNDDINNDIKIIMGDWSQGKQMRNFISTPQIGLKRKINKRFEVYNIDEFRTSKLHHKTETVCKNPYVVDYKNRYHKVHSVLTYQMDNKRLGCINRDKNSINNIKKLTIEYLKNKTRPEKYMRNHVLSLDNIKGYNHIVKKDIVKYSRTRVILLTKYTK